MGLIRSIEIGMGVNTGALEKGLKRARAALGEFASTAAKIGSAGAALGAGVAAWQVGKTIGGAVEAASSLNEQISKSRVVFGDASATVEKNAQQMADAFGIPKREFIDASSSIGLIGKASGLTQDAAADLGTTFAKLGADAASFYNVPLEDALMALRSGLVGEAEPMRRFGVLLNETAVKAEAARLGLAKLGAELTEGQKVQARSSLILKGMKDAQGDLARTAGSIANLQRAAMGRWENSLADLGDAIQPLTERFYQFREAAMGSLTVALKENMEALKAWSAEAIRAGGIAEQAFDGVVSAMGLIADGWQLMVLSFKRGQSTIMQAFYGVMKAIVTVYDGIAYVTEKLGLGKTDMTEAHAWLDSFKQATAAKQAEIDQAEAAPWASEVIKARAEAVKNAARAAGAEAGGAGGARGPAAEATVKAAELSKAELKKRADAEKKLTAEALKIYQETRTPIEKFRTEAARLAGFLAGGRIDQDTYNRAVKQAREEAFGKDEGVKFAGALVAGTAEAYSAQVRSAAGLAPAQDAIKDVAKSSATQVDLTRQVLAGINKLVDRAVGGAASAIPQLFNL